MHEQEGLFLSSVSFLNNQKLGENIRCVNYFCVLRTDKYRGH